MWGDSAAVVALRQKGLAWVEQVLMKAETVQAESVVLRSVVEAAVRLLLPLPSLMAGVGAALLVVHLPVRRPEVGVEEAAAAVASFDKLYKERRQELVAII